MLPAPRIDKTLLICLLAAFAGYSSSRINAQETRRQQETIPALQDLNGYFPFDVPADLDGWERRKSLLQKHLRVSLGLWPYPKRTPLNAVVHGAIDQGDYTIGKVYFQSLPGFYVTGNLYKPKNVGGKLPAIATPHGHFHQGRLGEKSAEDITAEIESGAESFRSNAKNVIQTRCANLAKMGCIVFVYDMIGYADSQQISYEIAHRFSKQRPEMNGWDAWGLFSPQAELHAQNVMGLQAWNSIRALDFLESLPDVDRNRIGVTGASGGGTQTFIVCALDDRPAAAFPAVMVSTAMQGGCTCENCSYLRVGTGNVELAAMFAPKPLGLTAANDWTKELASRGFPELQKVYEMYNRKENVELTARTEFGHNYNQISREAMYRWFKKHLKFAGTPSESEIEFLKPEQLTVFDDDHPRPPGGEHFERNLLVGLAALGGSGEEQPINHLLDDADVRKQLESMHGTTDRRALFRILHANWQTYANEFRDAIKNRNPSLVDYETNIGTFVDVVMNSAQSSNGTAKPFTLSKVKLAFGGLNATQWDFATDKISKASSVREIANGSLPRIFLITHDGFNVLQPGHRLQPFIKSCLESMTVSMFHNGWMSPADGKRTRRVNNPREALSYTVGYNAPQLARRADAWRKTTEMTTASELPAKESVYVVSLDRAGLEVALNARYLKTLDEIGGLVIHTHGFRFATITDIRDPDLLPGAVKYKDLPGLLTLAAPEPLLLIGEDTRSASAVVNAYRVAGVPENLTLVKEIPEGKTTQDVILEWIKNRETTKK